MADLPADERALEALLRERRFGPPGHGETTPWDFVRRWPDAIVRSRVWPIISRLLTDDDELIRARSVELVRVWSEGVDLTAPRLLEIAEQFSELYGSQAPEGVSLRSELAFALSNCIDENNGPRVAAVLRDMTMHEAIGGGAASVLGRFEPELVIALAQKWGDAQASWIVEATRTLAMFVAMRSFRCCTRCAASRNRRVLASSRWSRSTSNATTRPRRRWHRDSACRRP